MDITHFALIITILLFLILIYVSLIRDILLKTSQTMEIISAQLADSKEIEERNEIEVSSIRDVLGGQCETLRGVEQQLKWTQLEINQFQKKYNIKSASEELKDSLDTLTNKD